MFLRPWYLAVFSVWLSRDERDEVVGEFLLALEVLRGVVVASSGS